MGREVKRVRLDAAPAPGKPWPGYVNPHYEHRRPCPFCGGSGQNPAVRQLEEYWYDRAGTGRRWCDQITQDEVDALWEARRLDRWDPAARAWVQPPVPPPAAEVNAAMERDAGDRREVSFQPARDARAIYHDATNRWICVEARAKRLGVWGQDGTCDHCRGTGNVWLTPAHERAYDAWERTDPPAGDGWQMWETTTEGSPISPAFATPEELADWLARTGASAFGREIATREQWLAMIVRGWAPSAV